MRDKLPKHDDGEFVFDEDGKVILRNVRVSFPHIHEPGKYAGKED